ncbi:MAG: hypothetical protein OEM91_09285 [Hyphomicrobiales bacterium]|nr:hypothetical protein [Hyphomicrobiales bacterium]
MDVVALIIQLVSGALGGNVAGALLKNFSLGTLWNSVAGIVGGGIGGQILASALGIGSGGGLDIGSIITSIAGGGIGGGILLVVVGFIRQMMAR